MIFLTNEHIQEVLDMRACLDAMEQAYSELAEEKASYRPRIDFYVPQDPHYYRWGTMEGASRKLGVFAIFLSFGSVNRPPLPSSGSLRAGSPASAVR